MVNASSDIPRMNPDFSDTVAFTAAPVMLRAVREGIGLDWRPTRLSQAFPGR